MSAMNKGTAIVGLSFVTGARPRLGEGAVSVTGTPAFIIQTRGKAQQLMGAQPADAFFKTIDSLK